MPRKQFSLFQSHLDLSHSLWKQLIVPGDIVIDATCGNGHDTLFLATQILREDKASRIITYDIQEQALQTSKQLLQAELTPSLFNQIEFRNCSHETFAGIAPNSVTLIVYNLGYLPGANKHITTMCASTLQSIEKALLLIKSGGAISITCYPGHPEGKLEEATILARLQKLDPKEWSVCHHAWLNRKDAPSLLLIQRSLM